MNIDEHIIKIWPFVLSLFNRYSQWTGVGTLFIAGSDFVGTMVINA